MVHRMLRAFLPAGFADVRAQATDRGRLLTAPSHRASGHAAHLGAVDVERDASGHGLNVLLLQARRRTVIARGGTAVTGLDTGGEVLVHDRLLWQVTETVPTHAAFPPGRKHAAAPARTVRAALAQIDAAS